MTKRHIALLALVLACFAGAMFAIVFSQEQARQRTAANIEILCNELERMTGMPCALRQPPSGALDGRRGSSNGPRLAMRETNHPVCPATRPIWGTAGNTYHEPSSPYRQQVKRPVRCFTSVEEAREAGFRAPG